MNSNNPKRRRRVRALPRLEDALNRYYELVKSGHLQKDEGYEKRMKTAIERTKARIK